MYSEYLRRGPVRKRPLVYIVQPRHGCVGCVVVSGKLLQGHVAFVGMVLVSTNCFALKLSQTYNLVSCCSFAPLGPGLVLTCRCHSCLGSPFKAAPVQTRYKYDLWRPGSGSAVGRLRGTAVFAAQFKFKFHSGFTCCGGWTFKGGEDVQLNACFTDHYNDP